LARKSLKGPDFDDDQSRDDAICDVPTMTQQADLHLCFAVIKLKDGYF
jgi:hypothetical protein